MRLVPLKASQDSKLLPERLWSTLFSFSSFSLLLRIFNLVSVISREIF